MAFRDFSYPEVQRVFGLTLTMRPLYREIAPVVVAPALVEQIQFDVELATTVNSEKGRSEFLIAPVLSYVRRQLKGAFGLFSGIEFNVDPERGLNGYCDFIITRSPITLALVAPVMAIAEAKNDNVLNGLGQCIAAMVAAREFNTKAKTDDTTIIHGVVTTGELWGFLYLAGAELVYDPRHYHISQLDHIVAILMHILKTA